ncbi:hydrophobin [Crepidotus variabilis]|uniref:Hydrophobin n=1 Tax=Crepidotus variabilis TaxID=179855 RepID=A0A9P6EGY3_9AGAR|nr:hydrophobin [Crepidotus variabilis]
MFAKLSIIIASTLAVFVAAGGPLPVSNGIHNSCNTGPVQCCNTVKNSDTQTVNFIKEVFGVNAPITGMVGLQCSPISVIGAGSGANCGTQPVCCTGNHFEGGIAVGCNPINIAA